MPGRAARSSASRCAERPAATRPCSHPPPFRYPNRRPPRSLADGAITTATNSFRRVGQRSELGLVLVPLLARHSRSLGKLDHMFLGVIAHPTIASVIPEQAGIHDTPPLRCVGALSSTRAYAAR